jgi:hypothetical protein
MNNISVRLCDVPFPEATVLPRREGLTPNRGGDVQSVICEGFPARQDTRLCFRDTTGRDAVERPLVKAVKFFS